eukprot:1725215-Pleurochrysis_carterae.AAC.1
MAKSGEKSVSPLDASGAPMGAAAAAPATRARAEAQAYSTHAAAAPSQVFEGCVCRRMRATKLHRACFGFVSLRPPPQPASRQSTELPALAPYRLACFPLSQPTIAAPALSLRTRPLSQ